MQGPVSLRIGVVGDSQFDFRIDPMSPHALRIAQGSLHHPSRIVAYRRSNCPFGGEPKRGSDGECEEDRLIAIKGDRDQGEAVPVGSLEWRTRVGRNSSATALAVNQGDVSLLQSSNIDRKPHEPRITEIQESR
jgi:hypothetical protein